MLNTVIGQKYILLDEVDSTNNYAAKLLAEGKLTHGTVILAEKQTAGRGQRGNSWSAGAGKQFTASIYVETAFLSAETYLYLNLAVALAVRKTISSFITAETKIKWPNDVLVANKKLSGILIEAQWKGSQISGAVIGVGINLVPESDLPSSCSLSDFCEQCPSTLEIAQQFALNLETYFVDLQQGNWSKVKSEYLGHLWKINEVIQAETASGESITGEITGIDESGNLLFKVESELRSFGLQEIRFTY